MRFSIAVLSIAAAGCVDARAERLGPEPLVIEAEARPAACLQIGADFEPPGTLSHLVSATDSTILVHFREARVARVLDASLRTVSSVAYTREGPNGVIDPRGIALVDDTLFVIADGAARRLVTLDASARMTGSTDLSFFPDGLFAAEDGFVVLPLLLPGFSAELAYFVNERGTTSLGVAPVDAPDPQMKTLANMMAGVIVPGTRTLFAAHQFVAPLAHTVDLGELPHVRAEEVPVPIFPATRERAWWTPTPPFENEQIERIVAPAIGVTRGARTGEVTLLTRTGKRRGEEREKALVPLGADFRPLGAFVLPFNATHVAYVASAEAYLLFARDETWWQCTAA